MTERNGDSNTDDESESGAGGSNDRTQVLFEADPEAYEIAKEKLEHGEMSEELRSRVNEIAYGITVGRQERLKEELHTLRDRRHSQVAERDALNADISETERKIERVEGKLDTLRDQAAEYNGALDTLESQLHEGERLFPKHDGVETAAQIGGKSIQDVLDDLRERNPDVPAYAFELSHPNEPFDWREVDR